MRFKALIITALLLTAPVAQAEFIKTSAHVYQAPDQKGRIIISQRVPGLYITSSVHPVDIQQFDPTKLYDNDSDDIFIQFDPTQNKYSMLVVRGKQFKINGSFVINVGSLRITVDNQNPYCSVVNEPAESAPSVVGFNGTLEVVNAQGQEALALFEANQFSESRSLIKPYSIKQGALIVGDAAVTTPFVGVVVQDKNQCLVPEAIVLEEEVAATWDKLDDAGKKTASMKIKGKRSPLLKLLRLRTTKDSIIAFDYLRGKMKNVRILTDTPKVVCGIFPLERK